METRARASYNPAMGMETIVALFMVGFVIKATPGPGVFATVGRALFQGFGPTLVFIAGIMSGNLAYLVFAVAGLSVIAKEFGEFFFVVRLIGGGYLVYLGLMLWLRPRMSVETAPAQAGGHRMAYLSGLLLTFGNPKVILLYLGLLPTFVDATHLTVFDMGLLTVMFQGILGGTLCAYAYAAARARLLFRSERAMRRLNRGAGTVLIGTGGAMASS